MTYVPDYMTPQPQPPGRTGLVLFGILSILIGAMAGCTSLAMPMALIAARMAPPGTPTADVASIVIGMVIYIAVAVGFIWTGIGSCRCRRWVRPVVLCVAWPWLVIGVLSSIMIVPMLGDMPMPPGTTMPAQVRMGMLITMGSMMVLMYICIPSAYIAYYQRRSVQVTLDLCDPNPRWTERCPMPILGLSLWLLFIAVGSTSILIYRCVPFFGTYLTGLPAVGLILALSVTITFAAWACYHLRPIGWWIALVVIVGWCASTAITFYFTGIMEFYRHSGLPADQLAFLEQQPFVRGRTPLLMTILFSAICIGYLVFARRYFVEGRPRKVPMQTGV